MTWTTVKHEMNWFLWQRPHLSTNPIAGAFLYLPTSYNKFLPTVTILEAIFACPELMSLTEYTEEVYNVVPDSPLYNELVWPAPGPSFQVQGFDR